VCPPLLLTMQLPASEEAMTAALITELCSGRQFLDSLQKYREASAAQIAADSRKYKPNKNLRHVAEVPQREFFQMAHKYGHDCWADREFVRDFQRLEPTMSVHKI
jgi:hypothetical protein